MTRKKRQPSREPIDISNDVWFYEKGKSLEFVVWVEGSDGNRVCTRFHVPWRKIRKSVEELFQT